jgi:glutamate 5-kinase
MTEFCRERRGEIRRRLKVLVVKVGSNILTAADGGLSSRAFSRIARQIRELRENGVRVVLVSSGAIAAGRERIGLGRKPLSLAQKQAAASAGQTALMGQWEKAFRRHDMTVAQILLTPADIVDRERFTNLERTVETLLSLGILPIVNENDAVATFEIRFGDNDRLSAYVAGLVRAQCLLLLSDVAYLYTSDPRVDPSARPLPCVSRIDSRIERMAGLSRSGLGTGGMSSKVGTALWANGWGLPVGVLKGDLTRGIVRFFEGRTGTLFDTPRPLPSNRKIWIGHFSRPRGDLYLDAGAVIAIRTGRTSLLGAGVTHASGEFAAGETVSLRDSSGEEIARGIVRKGVREIAPKGEGLLVHLNDLVLSDSSLHE